MTPDQINAIAKASVSHLNELSSLSAQATMRQINAALTGNDRSALTKNDYIPENRDKLDLQAGRLHRLVLENLKSSKDMLSESAREFVEMPIVSDQMNKVIGEALTAVYDTAALKESIVEDVHSGNGPLKPETIGVLNQLADKIRSKIQEMNNTPFQEMPKDEEAQPMAAAMLIMAMTVTRAMSAFVKEHSGIEAVMFPLPSEDDLFALRDYVNENDDLMAEIVSMIKEDMDGLSM